MERIDEGLSTEELFSPVAPPKPERPKRRSRWPVGIAAIFLLSAAAVALLIGTGGRIDTVAVLPFETQHPSVAEGPESDYLSEGITEGIIVR